MPVPQVQSSSCFQGQQGMLTDLQQMEQLQHVVRSMIQPATMQTQVKSQVKSQMVKSSQVKGNQQVSQTAQVMNSGQPTNLHLQQTSQGTLPLQSFTMNHLQGSNPQSLQNQASGMQIVLGSQVMTLNVPLLQPHPMAVANGTQLQPQPMSVANGIQLLPQTTVPANRRLLQPQSMVQTNSANLSQIYPGQVVVNNPNQLSSGYQPMNSSTFMNSPVPQIIIKQTKCW